MPVAKYISVAVSSGMVCGVQAACKRAVDKVLFRMDSTAAVIASQLHIADHSFALELCMRACLAQSLSFPCVSVRRSSRQTLPATSRACSAARRRAARTTSIQTSASFNAGAAHLALRVALTLLSTCAGRKPRALAPTLMAASMTRPFTGLPITGEVEPSNFACSKVMSWRPQCLLVGSAAKPGADALLRLRPSQRAAV